jgi:hypothetical protein
MVLSAIAGVAFPKVKMHHAALASKSASRKGVFLVAGLDAGGAELTLWRFDNLSH